MPELFGKHGGFRRLHSFTLATIIQLEAQGRSFEETGGFSERLTARRVEARSKVAAAPPECPQCGRPMRRRKSGKGDFWGCSGFPECKGSRPIGAY